MYQTAIISGLAMNLPFRVQYLHAVSVQWIDFPFIDQLEIGSRLCSLVALSKTCDAQQFPVLGVDAVFEIHSTNSVVSMRAFDVTIMHAQPTTTWDDVARMGGVRMMDVGDFFLGTHLKFADGVVVS
jgi:hypothetical protein